MKSNFTLVFLFAAIFFAAILAMAQPAANRVAPPAAADPASARADKDKAGNEKRAKAILAALKLDDEAKAAKVHDIVVAHVAAWRQWHAQNDARLNELWSLYARARETKSQTNIDNAMAPIDAVYAAFKSQHDAFKADLATVLSPEQIETVQDTITINKVKITHNAYGEIFPGLTDAQKAFIMKKLKAAREEAVDAGSMKEVSAFFKKYKDQIEAYLTAQGYDVKESYRVFVAKQKAEAAAKKAPAAEKPKE
jgi:hypothetical protein